ncbi:rod shape-determining protein MreC [Candidatus Parcubacteria bacterium]|nr:rod shape-determining protein MreC [Candidatus Parcubacteria bacterium]
MKRTFLVKRNALLSSANLSWGTVALVVAVLFLLMRLLAPNFFWYVFAPAFRVSDALAQTTHGFLSSFGDAATLTLQNEKLANENTALVTQNQALVQKLGSITGLVTSPKGIVAGVVAHPPESPYDTLVLAAGSEDGVMLGMEALGEGNVPLGIVSSVLAHFSRVTLLSAPGVSLDGWVGHGNLPLILKGSGAGTVTASVPRSAGIVVGDTVSVPGPGSLPVGTVVRVDSVPSSPSVTLRIAPLFNLFSVTWVTLRDTGTALRAAFSTTTPLLP